MVMVCGFAWAGWVMLALLVLVLAVIGGVILAEVVRRWRHSCREYAAYQLGHQDGMDGIPLRTRK